LPYSKTTWKDRSVDSPLRFTMTDNGDGTITLVPQEGTIIEPGTPITSALLNNMEDGIASAARKTENQDMGGFIYSNMRIVIPSNTYVGAGGGIDMKNSDIIGINNIFMSDPATADSEAMQWAKSTTPAGSTDYNDYDSLRVYNGKLTLNGKVIGSSDAPILWTGGYYLTSTQHIVPSKPLQDCATGWLLIWSDYDQPTATPNNFDYNYTLIPKGAALYNAWHQALMAGYSTATTVTVNAKQFAYTNTEVWGADINNSADPGNNNQDVVLRWVVEF
jgi:hypothetical protein